MPSPLCLAITLAAALIASPAAAETLTGPAAVHDGDTLTIDGQRIRLYGVDAPELDQTCPAAAGGTWDCGDQARAQLAAMAADGVSCTGTDHDAYGRLLAVCSAAGAADINAELVTDGMAWAYTDYARDYVAAEAVARSAHAGIWQADTMPAWQYRVEGGTDGAPAGCLIKGNINGGNRIYHLPGTRGYADTIIDTDHGERWFCTEDDAIAAGWRAPR